MSDIIEILELSDGEKMHPLWVRLKAHLEKQLQMLRVRNDRPATELETAVVRGHIQCLKGLIALGDSRPLTGD